MSKEKNEAQVVKCKCGAIFAACAAPYCFEDAEWMKDVRKYSKAGYKIEMSKQGEWKFGDCVCNKATETDQLSIL